MTRCSSIGSTERSIPYSTRPAISCRLHFYFSPRTDTEFWRAKKEFTLTDSIKEKVAMYKAGVPVNPPIATESSYYSNFDAEFENFWTNGSYYCIFAGLGCCLITHCRRSTTSRRLSTKRMRCSSM
ncbi:tryptophan halogenase family protein [Mycobacterium ulcerans str. Harvey]|uniref:Tryptophan halogenase family protein n=1 Tax=Mycobacterium ulcerans str. Harvey TaxID=1299332 RepID=A0ABP3AJV9_MYCUL|nr:tryptophan halogenase family protein [Mycobacterium ulcerans str. Harvey]